MRSAVCAVAKGSAFHLGGIHAGKARNLVTMILQSVSDSTADRRKHVCFMKFSEEIITSLTAVACFGNYSKATYHRMRLWHDFHRQ